MELTTPVNSNQAKARGFFLKTLIDGFLILLPLTIILIILSVLFNFVFRIVSPLSSLLENGGDVPHWIINLMAVGILVVLIFLFGIFVQNSTGKTYFTDFEKRYLTKIPLYNLVHQTVYQFAGLEKLPFSEVVLIDPFKTGTLMTGFITAEINKNLYTVFVPTAPNPTNGNIYHVPRENIRFLDVAPQDAMRTIMGMGTGSGCLLK